MKEQGINPPDQTGREGEKDRGRPEIGLRREKERWGRKRKRQEERQKLRQLGKTSSIRVAK